VWQPPLRNMTNRLLLAATIAASLSLAEAQGSGGCDAPSTWITVVNESLGATGAEQIRTLGFPSVPANYTRVRIEWEASFVEFDSPPADIFSDFTNPYIAITNVHASEAFLPDSLNFPPGGTATFCKACSPTSTTKPGDTCWAVTATTDTNRDCGCNSGGWTGIGSYYGGWPAGEANVCSGWGGGFAGACDQQMSNRTATCNARTHAQGPRETGNRKAVSPVWASS
jgi:hypothetical protein